VQLEDLREHVTSSSHMHITLGQSQMTKLMNLFIHSHSNHKKNKNKITDVDVVMINIENILELQLGA
jgi:hypothetical protein